MQFQFIFNYSVYAFSFSSPVVSFHSNILNFAQIFKRLNCENAGYEEQAGVVY
jgi:hypothetical protein